MNRGAVRYNTNTLDISEYLMKEYSPFYNPDPQFYDSQDPEIQYFELESNPSIANQVLVLDLPLSEEIDSLCLQNACQDYLDHINWVNYDKLNFCDPKLTILNSQKNVNVDQNEEVSCYNLNFTELQDDFERILQQLDLQIYQQELLNNEDDTSTRYQEDNVNINNQEHYSSDLHKNPSLSIHDENLSDINEFQNEKSHLLKLWETHPKKQLISKLKSINNDHTIVSSDQQKVKAMKQTIQEYIFQHQKSYLEEAFVEFQDKNSHYVLSTLLKGIEQTFKQSIGGVIFQKRRIKLLKYMEKKNRRDWKKKINYDCRKKVADNRLRFKGKFITPDQICEKIGMPIDNLSTEEIKNLLMKKQLNE